jgi:hypothetical protein
MERTLCEFVAPREKQLSAGDDLDSVFPIEQRRAIWSRMQQDGFRLPELQLAPHVFLLAATMVIAPLVLLALALHTGFVCLSIFELSFLAYRLTRPYAIYLPGYCRTAGQAALCRKDLRAADGQPLPWTRDEIAMKVRMVIAESVRLPMEKLTEDTRLFDL